MHQEGRFTTPAAIYVCRYGRLIIWCLRADIRISLEYLPPSMRSLCMLHTQKKARVAAGVPRSGTESNSRKTAGGMDHHAGYSEAFALTKCFTTKSSKFQRYLFLYTVGYTTVIQMLR